MSHCDSYLFFFLLLWWFRDWCVFPGSEEPHTENQAMAVAARIHPMNILFFMMFVVCCTPSRMDILQKDSPEGCCWTSDLHPLFCALFHTEPCCRVIICVTWIGHTNFRPYGCLLVTGACAPFLLHKQLSDSYIARSCARVLSDIQRKGVWMCWDRYHLQLSMQSNVFYFYDYVSPVD